PPATPARLRPPPPCPPQCPRPGPRPARRLPPTAIETFPPPRAHGLCASTSSQSTFESRQCPCQSKFRVSSFKFPVPSRGISAPHDRPPADCPSVPPLSFRTPRP